MLGGTGGLTGGGLGLELGSVGVESKVPVGGVMGVNEGVSVGVRFLDFLPDGCWSTGGQGGTGGEGCGCSSGKGCPVFTSNFRVERSRILSGGLDMIT